MNRNTPASASARLLFEPLRPEHFPELFRVHNSNPDFIEASLGPGRRVQSLTEVEQYWREQLTVAPDVGRAPEVEYQWLLRVAGSGEVVGVLVLGLVHPTDRIPWIGLLELASGCHGRGFAREAAEHVENLVSAQGHRRIGLSVLTANRAALGFWQHLGYRREDGVRGEAWVLTKTLSPVSRPSS